MTPLRCAEIGWAFHPDAGGQGFATEAVRATLDIAFGHYRLHRVAAELDPRNTASARLCERVGITKEGHLRQSWWQSCGGKQSAGGDSGEWADVAIYGLLGSEWEDRRRSSTALA